MDIGAKELRIRLSEILDRVARGERIRILRRGKPAAELRPVDAQTRGLPDLSVFRSSIKAKGKPTSQLVIEERRKARY
ncbi:MAG: type II toxin-antitoxin system prevent-host-death family antitoxin [Steroidobacteraceae bacterium]